LFPALRVGIAAGLVGAMVAELPTGAQAGLGARLLTGSYYGNTVQIWSALVMSALLGLLLTSLVAGLEHLALRQRRQA
jgi:NitT/TauT family transport system permease protein